MIDKANVRSAQRGPTVGSRPGDVDLRRFMNQDDNLVRLLIITIAVFVIMSLARPDRFLTMRNFSSMAFQFPEFGLLAIGVMLTMLTGGIDLSAVSIANLSGIFAALVLTKLVPADQVALGILLAVAVSLIAGVTCGLLNGFLVGNLGIPAMLATLGTMQLFTGIAIVITKGPAIYGFPDEFLLIGNGSVLGLPVPFIIFLVFLVVFAILLRKSPLGFKLYMVGTNPVAARFSGLDNSRILMRTYMLSGLLAASAGIVMIARTNSAKADYGSSYILQALLVAVMGGVNPNGGAGTISGLVISILCLQFLSSGFNMLRYSNFFKEFIWGAVLLLVMVVNYIVSERRSRSKAQVMRKGTSS